MSTKINTSTLVSIGGHAAYGRCLGTLKGVVGDGLKSFDEHYKKRNTTVFGAALEGARMLKDVQEANDYIDAVIAIGGKPKKLLGTRLYSNAKDIGLYLRMFGHLKIDECWQYSIHACIEEGIDAVDPDFVSNVVGLVTVMGLEPCEHSDAIMAFVDIHKKKEDLV